MINYFKETFIVNLETLSSKVNIFFFSSSLASSYSGLGFSCFGINIKTPNIIKDIDKGTIKKGCINTKRVKELIKESKIYSILKVYIKK